MRILVACSDCQRQYDATGRRPGSRFRCRCGAVVTVQPPRGHDAAVVRCSSCGAPREEHSTACPYCHADFTLHERDLDTVCPSCLALVSSRARFCHHCGTRLAAETVARDQTPLACPVCGESHRLYSRQMGRVAALECGSCAGLWLGNAAFEQLTEHAADAAKKQAQMFSAITVRARKPSGVSPATQPVCYRPCPECGTLMLRRHYGRRSGVVIDVCREHGVWFDAEELPRILDWIRRGGLAQAQAERAREAELAQRTASRKPSTGAALPSTFSTEEPERGLLDFAIDTIVYWVMRRLGA